MLKGTRDKEEEEAEEDRSWTYVPLDFDSFRPGDMSGEPGTDTKASPSTSEIEPPFDFRRNALPRGFRS